MTTASSRYDIGYYSLLLGLPLILAGASGCAGPIRASGFLADYSELKPAKKINYFLAMDEDQEAVTTPTVIAVHRARWSERHTMENPELANWTEEQIEEAVYYATLLSFPSPVIVTRDTDLGPYLRRRQGVYRLDLAVTEVDPGIGWLRYLVGYYAGSVMIQAEFCLRDASNNRLIAAYATRQLHPGEAQSGLNPLAMSGRRTLKKLIPEIARDGAALTRLILSGQKDLYKPPKRKLFEPVHRNPKQKSS